jgi:hypothetical protein
VSEPVSRRKRPIWAVTVSVVAVALVLTHPGRALAGRLLSSLRIETPKRVAAAFGGAPATNVGRRVEDLVGRMVTDAVSISQEEPDRWVAGTHEAAGLAGFPPRLPKARADTATLSVIGARTTAMTVKRDQLRTILREAGEGAAVPASVDGASITIRSARGIRAQYGHCPAPPDTTLTGQLQGPPPTTPENHDCIVLTETPVAATELPPGLDADRLVRIALEVSGMSPDEARDFHRAFDWKTSLGMSVPRSMRTSEPVQVNGAPGLLMTAGWRRGPTYVLVWAAGGMVYSLTGYGSPTDAVPLAASLG